MKAIVFALLIGIAIGAAGGYFFASQRFAEERATLAREAKQERDRLMSESQAAIERAAKAARETASEAAAKLSGDKK